MLKYKKFFEQYQSQNVLFHATNIRNLNDIKTCGLIPTFGDTVLQAYGEYYRIGDNTHDFEGNELPELPIEGLLFFAETPHLKYSGNIYKHDFRWENALLCIVEKNETIFKKVDDYPRFIDYEGNPAYSYDGVNFADQLPIMVETGDWFSFEEQEVKQLLYGEDLYKYMEKNFNEEFIKLNQKSN